MTGTSHTLAGLSCGTRYDIGVTAVGLLGTESDRSQATSSVSTVACADTAAPSVPQGFRTTGTTQTSISVAWNASTDNVGVTGYRVYRNGTVAATVTTTNHTLTGLACGTSHEISVTAIDAAGNESHRPAAVMNASTSACSTPADTQAPSVPQGFRTTGTTQTSISVAWNASTDNVGVTGYRIYRGGTRIATVTQTNYTLTGLACGTEYEIGLTAIDAAGNESYRPEAIKYESTQACSTPGDTQAPSVPGNLRTTAKSQTSLSVAWNASTDDVGVTGYRVYRNGTLVTTTTNTNQTVSGLACGTAYEISVTAIDAAGNESSRTAALINDSTSACSTPSDTQAPSVPGNLRTTAKTQTSLSVAWNASTDDVGVAGYRVYRNGTLVTTVTSTSHTISGLACATSYEISVTAADAAGNESSRTASLINDMTSACDTPNPGGPAQVFISPSGSDSAACTSAAPCKSMSRAYNVAAAGNVIEIRAGSYGDQTVPSGSKSVTFRGVAGNKIRQVKSQASNITFDGLDMDAGGTKTTGAVFEHGGASNVTLKNSRVGNVVDEKGAMLGGSSSTAPTNLVIDNVEFHDIMVRGQDVHNECIMAHAPGITIRNSTFRNCHTMDISLGRGDWWGQPPYGNVVLENNVFGHSVNGSGWHYYGLAWFVGKFENARVVNNTFENQVRMDSSTSAAVPTRACGRTTSAAAGSACRASPTPATSARSAAPPTWPSAPNNSCGPPACPSLQTMPVGWVNPGAFDFHLRADSIAIDKGSATYAPARDKEGRARNGAPDAGAFEH